VAGLSGLTRTRTGIGPECARQITPASGRELEGEEGRSSTRASEVHCISLRSSFFSPGASSGLFHEMLAVVRFSAGRAISIARESRSSAVNSDLAEISRDVEPFRNRKMKVFHPRDGGGKSFSRRRDRVSLLASRASIYRTRRDILPSLLQPR